MKGQQLVWKNIGYFPGRIGTIYFIDEDVGFVSVSTVPNGQITPSLFRTTDGGLHWAQVYVETFSQGGYGIQDILMIDRDTGYTCGDSWLGHSIWKTIDGGIHWNSISSDARLSVAICKTKAGLVVSDFFTGNVRCSTDGISFHDVFKPPLSDAALGMRFSDDSHGVLMASYRAGNPWYTTSDGGLTWAPTTVSMESWSVYGQQGTPNFFAAPEEWSNGPVTTTSSFYRSTDYGHNWNIVHHFDTRITGEVTGINDLVYVQTHYPSGPGSGIYRSIDSGITWTYLGGPNQFSDTRFSIIPISCTRAVIFAAGDDYSVYKAYEDLTVSPQYHDFKYKLLQTSASTMDFGPLLVCAELDTFFYLKNTGCEATTISGITLSGTGFFVKDTSFTINPGDSQRIAIQLIADTLEKKVKNKATIHLRTNASIPIPPIFLSRDILYQESYPLHLVIDNAFARNQKEVKISIIADSLPSNLKELSTTLELSNSDLLRFDSLQSNNYIQVRNNQIFISRKVAPSSNDTLVTMFYKVFLTTDSITTLRLSNTHFGPPSISDQGCSKNISKIDTFNFLFSCAEPTIASLLRTKKPVLSYIQPNPSHSKISVTITTLSKTEACISIFDLFGRCISNKVVVLDHGRTELPIDISSYPSGIYSLRVTTPAEEAVSTFIKE